MCDREERERESERLNERGSFHLLHSPPCSLLLSRRMNLFNSLLSEVMFKKGIDSMDVDEMMCNINTSNQRSHTIKPFSLLEVKTFLQTLHDENRIFVSWEDGNCGIIYSI